MRRSLQILAGLVFLGTLVTWLATGAGRGWTKTSIAVKTLDPVTGIEGISYDKKFLPGIDFLGAGMIASVLLGGGSYFFRKQITTKQTKTKP